jgi:hypothetical protein
MLSMQDSSSAAEKTARVKTILLQAQQLHYLAREEALVMRPRRKINDQAFSAEAASITDLKIAATHVQ